MPRFVLLLHVLPDGSSHYDFLLERGDVLAAWRLPAPLAELPPEGAEAERLKNHRMVYLTHEGDVSGGRGTVRRVDEGTYEALVWGDAHIVVHVRGTTGEGRLLIESPRGGGTRCRVRFESGPARA
jgi:hypothetical protein